jgi:serine/threonine protein kinase
VLKTYYLNDVTAHKYYDSEIKAFESLQTHTSNMIGFHGSFRQGDRLNIILEFADKGTLENYFEQPPPTNGEDIIKFWEGMFKLIGALMAIHQVPGDAEQPLQGWVVTSELCSNAILAK